MGSVDTSLSALSQETSNAKGIADRLFQQKWGGIDLSEDEASAAYTDCLEQAAMLLAEFEQLADEARGGVEMNVETTTDELIVYPSLEEAQKVLGAAAVVRDGKIFPFPGARRAGDEPIGEIAA